MAGYIPEDIIREVQDRADIQEVISGYVRLSRSGKRWKGLCPFHNEKTPSFIVNPDMQAFHCFGCGKGGNVFTFIMEKEHVDFPEAVRILADRFNVFIPETQQHDSASAERKSHLDRLYELHKLMAELYNKNLYAPNGKAGLDYLSQRNFTDDIIKQFSLGFAPDSWDYAINQAKMYKYSEQELKDSGLIVEKEGSSNIYDRFRNRVAFPIHNERGKVIGFSARTIEANPQGGKYVNSPETEIFKKSRILYALHIARKNFYDKKFAVLCEGQIDVIAMHRAGFNNAVAPQGTAFTEEQAKLLKRYTNAVYICFDGDTAGLKATVKAIEIMLPLNMELRVISMPEGEDPDNIFTKYGREQLEELVNNAKDFFAFLFEFYKSQQDILTPYGKSKVVNELIKYLLLIENSVLQASYITMLSQKLSLPEMTIRTELRKAKNFINSKNRNIENNISPQQQNNPPLNQQNTQPKPAVKKISLTAAKAEEELLDLSIQHGDVGRRLEDELPHDMISETPVGQALNTAISLTLNGEWEFITQELNSMLSETPDPVLSRILAVPNEYPDNYDYNKAVSDCIIKIKKYHIDERIKELMRELKASLSDDKRKLLEEITNLQKEKLTLKQPKISDNE